MKTVIALSAVGMLGLVVVCDLCQPNASATTAPPPDVNRAILATKALEQRKVMLKVEGMTCGGCAIATRKVLARLPGVSEIDVNYEQKRAVVTYDPAKVTVGQMIVAVGTLGYTASVIEGCGTTRPGKKFQGQ